MLIEKIRADLLVARKARETVTANSLTALVGEAVMVGKNAGNRESTDEEVIATVRKFLKNLEETKRNLVAHGKDTAVCEEEIKILGQYLPQQMSADDLKSAITAIVAETAGANMGVVMKVLKERYAGLYDGKLASEVVKQVLA